MMLSLKKSLKPLSDPTFKVGDVVYHKTSYANLKPYGKGVIKDVKENKIYVEFYSINDVRVFKKNIADNVLVSAS